MRKQENDSDSTFTEETLVADLWDLWQAGQETTTTTILSGFIHMLNNPEVRQMGRENQESFQTMDEARKELIAITENKRQLSLTDKKNTPYLNALITVSYTSIGNFFFLGDPATRFNCSGQPFPPDQ